MRAEKQLISDEYVARLNAAPFFVVVDYQGLTMVHFSELRRRLSQIGAEVHVVKNSIFRLAARNAGMKELGSLTGQLAVVTGRQDISFSAKILKTFAIEFKKPRMLFGFLNHQRLEANELAPLADLPSLEILRTQIAGVLSAPTSRFVYVLSVPAKQIARAVQAKIEMAA